MTPPITQHQYHEEVQAIAEDCTAQPEDERHEWLHQTIDGHEWIIYTWKAKHVMLWTDNEDAAAEVGCAFSSEMNHGEYTTRAAFYAMFQDVVDRLD
tara:strand:- start:4968 stop:5258 length:291 start_codon:yes stop_codon:yes gene_type:complete